MATKIDQIVDFIENLEIGEKISIKSLAKELCVSEGTAYHGIKRAEQMSLVVTLPKAGTTRIKPKKTQKACTLSVSALRDAVDAEILVPARDGDVVLRRFVVADGSETELRRMFRRDDENSLCVVGDRTDMQRIALYGGAHLLLTSDAKPNGEVLQLAQKSGAAVLQTKYSAFHVLNILNTNKEMSFPNISSLSVRDIMQPAQYLYQNDIAAGARQIYKNCGITKIPILDEQGQFVGMLDTMEAYDADLSRGISHMVREKDGAYVVSSADNAADAINAMIATGTNVVFVENGNYLEGMVTFAGVIKMRETYYVSGSGSDGFDINGAEGQQAAADRASYAAVIPDPSEKAAAMAIPPSYQCAEAVFNRFCMEKNLNLSVVSENTVTNRADELRGKVAVTVGVLSKTGDYMTAECVLRGERDAFLIMTVVAKIVSAAG